MTNRKTRWTASTCSLVVGGLLTVGGLLDLLITGDGFLSFYIMATGMVVLFLGYFRYERERHDRSGKKPPKN